MYRKMLKISYTSHTTNEEVLKRIHEKGLSLSLEENIKNEKNTIFWTFSKERHDAKNIVGRKSMCEKTKGTST